ncbi:unnamed protein product, partial [Mesorhabditis belari]|uniref:Uncharacterized protein n=1 Tax=Mesorhabditis belari TaxID=2138241 RepID=A0AAF3F6P7_9BILA
MCFGAIKTVEMQNYFLLIYLLQMFNTSFTFLLPCFMLILAMLNISILPEFVSSSFVLFMYFHSAFNSLILIFSTRTYRQVLYGWWLKVYSLISRKATKALKSVSKNESPANDSHRCFIFRSHCSKDCFSESTPLVSRRMKRRLIMRQPMMDIPFEDVLDIHNLGASKRKLWHSHKAQLLPNLGYLRALVVPNHPFPIRKVVP